MRLEEEFSGTTHDGRIVCFAKRQVLFCDLLVRPTGHVTGVKSI